MVSALDVLVVDAAELRALGGTASRARDQIENVARQAGGIIGGLDGRGWNIGAVQSKWAGARAQFNSLAGELGSTGTDLTQRAILVDFFENGLQFGIPAVGIQLLPWLMVPGADIKGVSPVTLLEWSPFWSPLLAMQSGLVTAGAVPGGPGLPGYSPFNLSALTKNWFRGGQFQEKKYEIYLKKLLGGGPISETLAKYNGKFGTQQGLGKFAASLAEKAQQAARLGSPAGAGRKLTWVDKLDPTVGATWQLLNANASVFSWGIGNKNASLSAEILAAHAYALAGLSVDWKRRRFVGSFDLQAAANLADVTGQVNEQLGSNMLGESGSVAGNAAVGANADAKGQLTVDALKGKVSGDLGASAIVGADASAQGSVGADVAGAKAQMTAGATGYIGIGGSANADVNVDPLHGKFGFKVKVLGAVGLGGGVTLGANVDLSNVPHEVEQLPGDIASGASSLWNDVFG